MRRREQPNHRGMGYAVWVGTHPVRGVQHDGAVSVRADPVEAGAKVCAAAARERQALRNLGAIHGLEGVDGLHSGISLDDGQP